jgi:FkbM family methyltransferase
MAIPQQIANTLGRDSWLVRRLRPLREVALAGVYGRRGMTRCVNGASLRVLPQYRWYFAPDYDAPVARFLHDRVGPGAVCLSVGANLGVYPLQFAHWSGPTGKVFAFEPNPQTAAVLRRHVALNGLDDRVRVIERAVAECPGQATFHAAGVDGMSRLGAPNPELTGLTRAITVPVDSLDRFCADEGIGPDALMIDVEGFEVSVLRGAKDLFRGRPPKVAVVELHPNAWAVAGTDRVAMEQLLSDYRLRAVPLSGQTDPLGEYGHVSLEPTLG